MSKPRATTCRVCGQPRNTRPSAAGGSLVLCEEHLLEYWRTRDAKKDALADEQAPVVKHEAPADIPVLPQVTVTIDRDQATLSLDEFWTLLRAASPPEKDAIAERVTRKLALVSTNGLQVVLYEAVPRGVQNLRDTGDGPDYLKRFEELRAAGFTVALVG